MKVKTVNTDQVPRNVITKMSEHPCGKYLTEGALRELALMVLQLMPEVQNPSPAVARAISETEIKIRHPAIQRRYCDIVDYLTLHRDKNFASEVQMHLTGMQQSDTAYFFALELMRLELLDKVKMS